MTKVGLAYSEVTMETRFYKISDGNGGYKWDMSRIKETVIAGLILSIIISAATIIGNRVFTLSHIELTLARMEKHMLRSVQMDEMQNKQININTELLYKKYYPGVPPPQVCWPTQEVP